MHQDFNNNGRNINRFELNMNQNFAKNLNAVERDGSLIQNDLRQVEIFSRELSWSIASLRETGQESKAVMEVMEISLY